LNDVSLSVIEWHRLNDICFSGIDFSDCIGYNAFPSLLLKKYSNFVKNFKGHKKQSMIKRNGVGRRRVSTKEPTRINTTQGRHLKILEGTQESLLV
jgi:hypothetical protein